MRTKQPVDKNELKRVIEELEKNNNYPGLTHLYAAVAETEWAKSHSKPLTPSVILLRVQEYKIPTVTQPGRRGRTAGVPHSGGARKRKQKNNAVGELARVTPLTYTALVERIRGGSKVAAIKLKCLECCSYQRIEVRECTVSACALWTIRPYQKSLDEGLDGEEVGD